MKTLLELEEVDDVDADEDGFDLFLADEVEVLVVPLLVRDDARDR